jgi:hypothetical protein
LKRFVCFLFYSFCLLPIFSEPIRYQIESYEFYFINDRNIYVPEYTNKIVQNFADQFILELSKESERLNLKRPSEATVFIFETSKTFSKTSGQPSFVAAHFVPETNRFFFQNPNTLNKRNILIPSIRHEICHFLSPHLKNENLKWIEESHCEALYPTNTVVPKKFLNFPKSWDQFKKIHSNKSSKKEDELRKYKLLASWGNWILQDQGEIRFRNFLEEQVHEKEWKILYSKFLKSE